MVISVKALMLCAPVDRMGSAPSAAAIIWEKGLREAKFWGFKLFAHTTLGGEIFRVEGVLRVRKSRKKC